MCRWTRIDYSLTYIVVIRIAINSMYISSWAFFSFLCCKFERDLRPRCHFHTLVRANIFTKLHSNTNCFTVYNCSQSPKDVRSDYNMPNSFVFCGWHDKPLLWRSKISRKKCKFRYRPGRTNTGFKGDYVSLAANIFFSSSFFTSDSFGLSVWTN